MALVGIEANSLVNSLVLREVHKHRSVMSVVFRNVAQLFS